MRNVLIVGAALLVPLVVTVSSADAQVLTAEKCLPSGFAPVPPASPALAQALEQAGAYGFEASRAQPDYPRWAAGDGAIKLGCGWSLNPYADRIVQMILENPQDPGTDLVTHRTEPVGKESFRNGVLLYTKSTYLHVGIGTQPDLITYSGQWHGAHAGGLLSIAVDNVLGSRNAIRGWVGEVLDRRSPVP
jgi:hypothetical protein